MPKELVVKLSRFFKENIDPVQSINSSSSDLEMKKDIVIKLPRYPEFELRGFSSDEILSSEIKSEMSGSIEEFLGFSSKEIEASKAFCDERLVENLELGECEFLGFSKEDQSNSLSIKSSLSKPDDRLRTEFYKTIDRRILNNYSTNHNDQRIVCSKYWCQDLDMPFKPNGRKRRDTFESGDLLDRESVIILQIKKLKQELKEIRRQSRTYSEKTKLQKSHFIQIKKELIMPQFIPPKSPHHLLEEELYHDPWALLVATIFLNKTACLKARPYFFWFLEENSDPLTVVGKRVEDLKMYFKPLGLQSTRASQVWRMSHDFLYKQWTKVSDLYGIGKYGEDAFQMFCLGDFSVEPDDRFLRIYKNWFMMQEKKLRMREMNS